MKSKYKITIEDIENKNIVFTLDISENDNQTKFAVDIIWDLIVKYEKKYFKQCNQCLKYDYKKLMSKPEGRKIWFCQDCLEKVMSGSQQVKNIND